MNYAQAVTPHPFGPFARAALLTGVRSPERRSGLLRCVAGVGAHDRACVGRVRVCDGIFWVNGAWANADPKVPLVGEVAAKVIVPPGERVRISNVGRI